VNAKDQTRGALLICSLFRTCVKMLVQHSDAFANCKCILMFLSFFQRSSLLRCNSFETEYYIFPIILCLDRLSEKDTGEMRKVLLQTSYLFVKNVVFEALSVSRRRAILTMTLNKNQTL